MAPRLTANQQRRIREENQRRRRNRLPLMTNSEAADFIGVAFDSVSWGSDTSSSYDTGSSSDCGSFSCGGGGGCD